MASNKYRLGPVSAYAIARQHDASLDTEEKFLESLNAYGLAKKYQHFQGTVIEWLESLHATDSQVAHYLVTHPEILQQINPMRGSVATMSALPTEGNAVNDTYYVQSERAPFTWTGSEWVRSGINETDYADILAEIKKKVETVTEPYGKNMVDISDLLQVTGWSNDGEEYFGPLRYVNDPQNGGFANGLPVSGGFKENTQYTASLLGYDTTTGNTGNGLRLTFQYTDGGEVTTRVLNRTTTSFTRLAATSDPGRTVSRVVLGYSNGPSDVWRIKELQVEEGAEATTYEPPGITAIDSVARGVIEDVGDIAGNVDTLADLLQEDIFVWEQGAIDGNGQDTEAAKSRRIRTPMYELSAYYIVPQADAAFWVCFYQEDGTFISWLANQRTTVRLLDVAPTGAEKFRLCAEARPVVDITPAFGSHILVMGPKNAELYRQIKELETVVEPTGGNLFDKRIFINAGIKQTASGWYAGTGAQFSSAGGIKIPGGWKPNARYTISFKIAPAISQTESGRVGQLRLSITYTDSTADKTTFSSNQVTTIDNVTLDTAVRQVITTDEGKSVKSVAIVAPAVGAMTWYLAEFQIEEGTEVTEAEEVSLTAVDKVARAKVSAVETELGRVTETAGRNLFNMDDLLAAVGWAKSQETYLGEEVDVYSGQPKTQADLALPIIGGYKSNTQYAVSCLAAIDSRFVGTNEGLAIRVEYTDGNDGGSLFSFYRNQTEFALKSGVTAAGKTVKRIYISSKNGQSNIWKVARMQIEEGATATAYDPIALTAVDRVARASAGRLAPSGGDDTARILSALQSGEGHLGEGEFHVNGLDMPAFSLLRGSGRKTVVRFDSGAKDYAIRIGQSCTIRDLKLVEQDISAEANRPGSDYTGGNTGIYGTFLGNEAPTRGVVSGVEISGFSHAGIKLHETGTNYEQGVVVSDSYIHHNNIGVFFSRHGEYNRVTGCAINCNYYGMINNGGNNQIAACSFSGNAIGMLFEDMLYDGNGDPIPGTGHFQTTNMAHGGVTGCSFNHSFTDENASIGSGLGLMMKNVSSAEMFSGCSFGSPVTVENCNGVTFQGVRFGNYADVTITNQNYTRETTGGYIVNESHPVTFIGCIGNASITANNSTVHVTDCYKTNGAAWSVSSGT